MPFKSLTLVNFQSHKNTVLEFDPRFNCIVGSSNVGKTAISRALGFILGGPWDSSWVRNGEKSCSIRLETTDGVVVTREKGEKVNKYSLTEAGKSEQVFENFGTEVPSDISRALQIYKVQIDSNEFLNLNISSQLDPLFLLSKTGSFKAKVIGKLSGAHYLDYALRELNKDKRNLQTEKNRQDVEIIDIQKELQRYAGLDADKQWLDRIAADIKALDSLETRLNSLRRLVSKANDWKERYTSEIENEARFSIPLPTAEGLDSIAATRTKLTSLHSKYLKLATSEQRYQMDLAKAKSQMELGKDTYVKLLEEQSKCPTCFNPVGPAQIEAIKASL